MAENLELVIFDLDGTLVDAYRAVSESINFTLKELGLPQIDDNTIKRSVGWGDKNLLEKLIPADVLSKGLSIYRQHHRFALKNGTKFLPGAKNLLDELNQEGYLLAIASNRPTRFSEIILKQLNVRGHFNHVLCADQAKAPKPAGDMLVEILSHFSLDASQALYVGDMTIDVQTGHAAGVKTVAVTTGSSYKNELEALKPFRVVGHLDDVLAIIRQIA